LLQWYTADWDYGHTTIAFFCAIILVAGLINIASIIHYRRISQRTTNTSTTRYVNCKFDRFETDDIRSKPFRNAKTASPSFLQRLAAGYRFFTARQFRLLVFNWYSPPLSAIVVISAICIFVMSNSQTIFESYQRLTISPAALMLAVRPYVWPNPEMGHSPPIATRSGRISVAIMPFMMFALLVQLVLTVSGADECNFK
jgi:hypothetical protein